MTPLTTTFGASEPNAATHTTNSHRARSGTVPRSRRAGVDSASGSSTSSSTVDGVRGARADSADAALVELVRSRLETLGPVTADALARPLQIPIEQIRNAMDKARQEQAEVFKDFSDGDILRISEKY